MAFITRVRMEGAGESPEAVFAIFEEMTVALDEYLADTQYGKRRDWEEVFERVQLGGGENWYKGRRVVWFVEPGGANDPNAGKAT